MSHEHDLEGVWVALKVAECLAVFSSFFFFFSAALFDQVNCKQYIHALFTDPQIPLFSNFFIKNGSHDTIHTFKNYFATVFSVSAKISSIQIDPVSLQSRVSKFLIAFI